MPENHVDGTVTKASRAHDFTFAEEVCADTRVSPKVKKVPPT